MANMSRTRAVEQALESRYAVENEIFAALSAHPDTVRDPYWKSGEGKNLARLGEGLGFIEFEV